ncbi:MAG: response regulator [Bryobacteraceae bacterium]|nr:response regulator [Bryobacteraceae bacterium]
MDRIIRLLAVECEVETILLLEEALTEMTEGRYWQTWGKAVRPVFADCLEDAICRVREEFFDAILLSLTLPDSNGLHTFLTLKAEAPAAPVIVLARDDEEERLAAAAVREGAQDYLLKSAIDSIPLARMLRQAIERQRLRETLRGLAFRDDLTGLYNSTGFLTLASQNLALAARLKLPFALLLFEIDESGIDTAKESSDLAIIRTAEVLRKSFDEVAILGRLQGERFAAATVNEANAGMLEQRFQRRLQQHNARASRHCPLQVRSASLLAGNGRYPALEDLVEMGERMLCENGRDASHSLRSGKHFVLE